MARSSQAGQEDALDRREFNDDALWICREALLPHFDSKSRGAWRLVCRRACEGVKTTTRCLSWDGDTNRNNGGPDMGILHQCPVLERVCVLGAARGLTLAGLPPRLRGLEVKLLPGTHATPEVAGLHDVQMSVALSPLTALTQLEEAVLYGFPDTSLAALEVCPALRSLDVNTWCSLTNISALSVCCNLNNLSLTWCHQLQDITALSACFNLHNLDMSGCEELQDITSLTACSNLHNLDLSGCYQVQDITALSVLCSLHTLNLFYCELLQDITSLSACCNLHTLDLSYCEQLRDITALCACSSLHTLDLRGCEQLQGITALPAWCTVYKFDPEDFPQDSPE